MTGSASRRLFLSGLLATAGTVALAEAPFTSPRPPRRVVPKIPTSADLVASAGLGGDVGYAVADVKTGVILDVRNLLHVLPPASTAKAPTALYALDALGPAHRFSTRLIAAGPVVRGRIEGNLILQGGGDPTLDTDALGQLAADLKAAGIHGVAGDFLVDDTALPTLPWIDPDQPEHVGYNPTISGLNLNYNRVHFEWKQAGSRYDVTMEARALKYRPGVQVAKMEIVDRQTPVFTYETRDGIDRWTVARRALGREGARWLPVRRPTSYAAEVFRTLARSHGIELKAPAPGAAPPDGAVLAEWQSEPLDRMLTDMLEYSTNLTAEIVGLTASARLGTVPDTLATSAARMDGWLKDRFRLHRPGLVDHSGLGYGNGLVAADMVRMLAGASRLEPLLPEVRITDDGRTVRAKTGTLNFVSALAGYAVAGGGRKLAFAIFTADTARRDAIPPEQRERPDGARAWANRSRQLQRDLIQHWSRVHAA